MAAKKTKPLKAQAAAPAGAVMKRKTDALGLPRQLASCDKKVRDQAIELLARWLQCRETVEESELNKIWKGLFYCYWHTDKSSVQAELAERLAGLVSRLNPGLGLKFFECFLVTVRREWAGIDHHRIDKFYLLMRKFVVGMLNALKQLEWSEEWVVQFMEVVRDRGFPTTDLLAAQGASMHLAGIFVDELTPFLPVGAQALGHLLEPFMWVLSRSPDKVLVKRVKETVFDVLLEEGLKFEKGEDTTLGSLAGALSLSKRLFQLAAEVETLQSNRGLLFSLSTAFKKLKKPSEGEGVDANKTTGKKIKKSAKKASTSSPKVEERELSLGDQIISNLESKFADAADEAALPPLQMVLSPLIVGNKRKNKQKQQKSRFQQQVDASPKELATPSPVGSSDKKRKRLLVPVSPINTASKKKHKRSPEAETPASVEAAGMSSTSSKKAKKVRFALKRNTVSSFAAKHEPLSPAVTPKRSALKKGLSPGPIRRTPLGKRLSLR